MKLFMRIFTSILLLTFILGRYLYSEGLGIKENIKNNPVTIVLNLVGPIGPATSSYIKKNIEKANLEKASLIILRVDTPGGLDTSMREIIKSILTSKIPVISYVTPSGARAASAGTYILYASHIAAMSPGTNLGASTPVQLQKVPSVTDKNKKGEKQKDNPMKNKIENDAVAYIKSLAKMRGRNEVWAEKSVRLSSSVPAHIALEKNIINLMAYNHIDLLDKVHGKKVKVNHREVTLNTKNTLVKKVVPDWHSRFLSIITNPNMAYILMMIGIYGLILEFYNPGGIVPGIVGGISLLIALYAFQLLPVNYTGVALIVLGILLLISEAFAPGVGVLGIGGTVSFAIGSVILIDTQSPHFGINLALVGSIVMTSVIFFIFAIGYLIKSKKNLVVSGKEELLNSQGVALENFKEEGLVRVHSENWSAHAENTIRKDQKIKVIGIKGLTLLVAPLP